MEIFLILEDSTGITTLRETEHNFTHRETKTESKEGTQREREREEGKQRERERERESEIERARERETRDQRL